MMRAINPGSYRHRIAIQQPVETQSSNGESVTTWADVVVGASVMSSVQAECLTGPGREAKMSGVNTPEVDLRVSTRWFPGFDPAWRIVWDGYAYNVRSVETDSTGRREYRLTCRNTREAIALPVPALAFTFDDGDPFTFDTTEQFDFVE